MKFTQTSQKEGEYTFVTIREEDNNSSITVIPECGARLHSFTIRGQSGNEITVIDGYKNIAELKQEGYAKGSFLAPFPNRIADGEYEFHGENYQLPINKADEHNAIHGFISQYAFHMLSSEESQDGYRVVLHTTVSGGEGYPFPFEVTVTYLFTGIVVHVTTDILNLGKKQMPVGFGWHPYITTGRSINECVLQIPTSERLIVDERLIPTKKKVPFSEFSAPYLQTIYCSKLP